MMIVLSAVASEHRLGGSSAEEREQSRKRLTDNRARKALTPFLVASFATAPLLVPRGPGNSVPGDTVNLLLLAIGAIVLWRMRARFYIPLGLSNILFVTGGLIGLSQSLFPVQSALAILQDIYLFSWFVVVVNLLLDGDGRAVRLMTLVWVVVAFGVALIMTMFMIGFPFDNANFGGSNAVDPYGRVQASFRDPNLAGNYLVMSLFLMWASPRPRTTGGKILVGIPFLLAIYSTASNTALTSLAVGTALVGLVSFFRKRVSAAPLALAGAATILLLATLLPPSLGTGVLVRAVGGTSAFKDSLGRATESFEGRQGLWRESASLLGSHLALGIGPSVTDETLQLRSAPPDELHNDYVATELHNDYVASFLERGFVGGLGLMMLVAMICVWTIRAAKNRQLINEGWHPTALIGCTVSILLSAITLETLHFRHIWLYLALIVALCLIEPKVARFTK
jgi:hypothetical protein